MMHDHSQETSSSLHVETQILKQALDASQKKVDRYAHLIATLFDELDSLRTTICHDCKMKSVYRNNIVTPPVTVAAPYVFSTASTQSGLQVSVSNSASQSLPIGVGPPIKPAPPNLSTAEAIHDTGSTPATNTTSHENLTTPYKHKSMLPEWTALYNPEVKQALNFRIAHFFPYETSVYCVKISPDGQRVAIGVAHKGKTYINEVKSGLNIRVLVDCYIQRGLSIYCVQFSPNGQCLATAASDSKIRMWNIAKGRMQAVFKGHTGRINEIAFSPNGRSLVSTSSDLSVRIWNIRDGSSRKLTDGDHNLSLAFSPDGRYIAAGKSDSSIRIWNLRTRELVAQWGGHTNGVSCTEFTPDGKGLMSGSKDKSFKYWDMSSLGTRKGKVFPAFPEIRRFEGHTDAIRCIAFFPGNNQWVLSCSDDRSVRLWDAETGVWQLNLQGHTGCVRAVDISRKGNLLVTASKDHYVTFWQYEVL